MAGTRNIPAAFYEQRMKKHLPTIILIAVFVLGFGILMYPTFANYWNSKTQTRAIAAYDERMAVLQTEDYSAIWEAAEEYNKELAARGRFMSLNEEELEVYNSLLDPIDTGMMGYIVIDKINVRLPIYHTVDEGVLQIAAGHLPESSLPTGGIGNHIALSGHRGLPSALLFTDLDQLIVGDTFVLNIMDRTLTYEVDQIKIVLPEEVGDLEIVPGEDYCTLITCTPYGVNSHRMLIRGTRTANALGQVDIHVPTDARQIDRLYVAIAIAVPILLVLFIILMVTTSKRARGKKNAGTKTGDGA